MAVQIVPISPEQIEACHAVCVAVAREHAHWSMAPPSALARYSSAVLAGIDSGVPHLVGLDEAEVVGWCDVTPRERSTPQACGILGMGLLPSWRGHGLGGRLMRAALARCREFGYQRIELTVSTSNTAAMALYGKTGFTSGTSRECEPPNQFIVMALPLDNKP